MTDLPELLAQTASALVGTVAGGAIALYVARWQTLRTAEIQARTTTAQENAAVQLAHSLRVHERETTAARALLERLEGLYQWLPSLPDVAEDHPVLSEHARDNCSKAMQSVRSGMNTDLLMITDPVVRDRYRALVELVYDTGYRGAGQGHRERQIRDARNYLRHVQHTLESVIDGAPLPRHAAPPRPDRPGDEAWLPPDLPPHWTDPADGS
ncbi:hypothetical protein AB0909_24980 [Streptomyces albidoflavus]|uniref:Secreted protein n=1 Tax=Streptomyces wadayamensis TaxID=141454 RepID=A0ABR4SB46_9ACTN|nr:MULTISPECIES: hypothetical protein [Streptomyces]MYX86721.1 hypothetical protein [Streptomyces sp. SID4915]KDR62847.1 hypothetical protein DC60_29750 [Streptomyces wadayamensis]MBK3382313.1 hypothetical protein [Streptomyces sp. DEF147AK]MBK3388240.1 hypothetical protein [Streptomyces sp. DEF1AK]NEC96796.1 hypothetical protein [Streptomyces albidoflavus]